MIPGHIRKKNRLPLPSYLGFRSHLITICTQGRERRFISPRIVDSIVATLSIQSQKNCFAVHAYCFMPDHCHLVLLATAADSDLVAFVRDFKGNAAATLRHRGFHDLWQKGFHDRILRSSQEVSAASAYIFENPLRVGLTKTVYDWPFSGSFVFEWRRFADPQGGVSRNS
jgi:putative transposase